MSAYRGPTGDFEVIVVGSTLGSLQAVSPKARRWVKANLPDHADPGAVIVGDERYLGEIVKRLAAAGLKIRGPEH